MSTDWEEIGRVALHALERCSDALRETHPQLLARSYVSANDRFPLRVSVSLSASGDRQAEHLALYIGFHLNESSGLDASADVTQGDCQYFKYGPQASIGVDDPGVFEWALDYVASSMEFLLESVPEVSEALIRCLDDERSVR